MGESANPVGAWELWQLSFSEDCVREATTKNLIALALYKMPETFSSKEDFLSLKHLFVTKHEHFRPVPRSETARRRRPDSLGGAGDGELSFLQTPNCPSCLNSLLVSELKSQQSSSPLKSEDYLGSVAFMRGRKKLSVVSEGK